MVFKALCGRHIHISVLLAIASVASTVSKPLLSPSLQTHYALTVRGDRETTLFVVQNVCEMTLSRSVGHVAFRVPGFSRTRLVAGARVAVSRNGDAECCVFVRPAFQDGLKSFVSGITFICLSPTRPQAIVVALRPKSIQMSPQARDENADLKVEMKEQRVSRSTAERITSLANAFLVRRLNIETEISSSNLPKAFPRPFFGAAILIFMLIFVAFNTGYLRPAEQVVGHFPQVCAVVATVPCCNEDAGETNALYYHSLRRRGAACKLAAPLSPTNRTESPKHVLVLANGAVFAQYPVGCALSSET